MFYFLFLLYVDHRDIPVLTPSFPTLRFSDLGATSPTAFDSGFAGVGGVAPTYGLAHTLFGSPSRARPVLARARRAAANAIARATASTQNGAPRPATAPVPGPMPEIGTASRRERVGQTVSIQGGAEYVKQKKEHR